MSLGFAMRVRNIEIRSKSVLGTIARAMKGEVSGEGRVTRKVLQFVNQARLDNRGSRRGRRPLEE